MKNKVLCSKNFNELSLKSGLKYTNISTSCDSFQQLPASLDDAMIDGTCPFVLSDVAYSLQKRVSAFFIDWMSNFKS